MMTESSNNNKFKVLVTGASGYLASHCTQLLLVEGYSVRGTVRSLKNDEKIAPLRKLENAEGHLELVEADLERPETWSSAVSGCDYVLHVASPFPIVADDSIVKTAVDGTLNVLKACADCESVRKVVLTSSCSAINEGHEDEDRIFTEEDWTNVESKKVYAYPRSKTEAEKAAWDFVENIPDAKNKFKLTCLHPTLIVGPLLTDTQGTSITIIRRFLNHEMPAVPALQLALVDVRDVAKAHVLSMRNDSTDGQRILVTSSSFWFFDIAKTLAREFKPQGYCIPCLQVPYVVVWLYSWIDPQSREILSRLNREVSFDNSKALRLLGMDFINPQKSLIEMAYSMIERGIVPKRSGYSGPSTS
jgi:nucleoside-diphosphate-sugar epimerase